MSCLFIALAWEGHGVFCRLQFVLCLQLLLLGLFFWIVTYTEAIAITHKILTNLCFIFKIWYITIVDNIYDQHLAKVAGQHLAQVNWFEFGLWRISCVPWGIKAYGHHAMESLHTEVSFCGCRVCRVDDW